MLRIRHTCEFVHGCVCVWVLDGRKWVWCAVGAMVWCVVVRCDVGCDVWCDVEGVWFSVWWCGVYIPVTEFFR